MKALSVRSPWAQFIMYGVPLSESVDLGEGRSTVRITDKAIFKNVENRSWPLWRYFDKSELPVRVYVHCGSRDDNDMDGILDLTVKKIGLPFMMVMYMMSPKLGRGVILGEIDFVDCVQDSKSPWAVPGQYHFVLANPKPYKVPVPCRGKLGFFEPEIDFLKGIDA